MDPTPFYGARAEHLPPTTTKKADFAMKQTNICRLSGDINDVTVEKVTNVDENLRSQTAVESVCSVSKLSTESVGSCRELVANSVHTADATQLDN